MKIGDDDAEVMVDAGAQTLVSRHDGIQLNRKDDGRPVGRNQ